MEQNKLFLNGVYTSHRASLAEDPCMKSADQCKIQGRQWVDVKYLFDYAIFSDLKLTSCTIISVPAVRSNGNSGSTYHWDMWTKRKTCTPQPKSSGLHICLFTSIMHWGRGQHGLPVPGAKQFRISKGTIPTLLWILLISYRVPKACRVDLVPSPATIRYNFYSCNSGMEKK